MTTKEKTQRVVSFNPQKNGKMIDHDLRSGYAVVAPARKADRGRWYDENGMVQLVTVRVWNTPACTRASVWVHVPGGDAGGHGTAGGCGYHRTSAALQAACNSAGLTFALPFDGYGEGHMIEALQAVARHLGYRRTMIVRF